MLSSAFSVFNVVILGTAPLVFSWGLYLALKPMIRYSGTLLRTEHRHRSRMKKLHGKDIRLSHLKRMAPFILRLKRELELLLKATMRDRFTDGSVQQFVLLSVSGGLS